MKTLGYILSVSILTGAGYMIGSAIINKVKSVQAKNANSGTSAGG